MSRIDVMGVAFDALTKAEAVEAAKRLMEKREAAYMVTPNPEIVMASWEDASLASALKAADLVIPDGIGVVKAASILGTPVKGRVPGIEVAAELLKYCAEAGKSVFLFGAKPGVAEKAAEKMKADHPGLNICGINDGYFKDSAPIVEKINAAKPDFLMVCLGAPKQENWMAEHKKELNVGLMGGFGGSLDVFAGTVPRAPVFWQKLNLEWLYRCIKEPKRFKRIYRLPLFLLKAVGRRIGKMIHGKER